MTDYLFETSTDKCKSYNLLLHKNLSFITIKIIYFVIIDVKSVGEGIFLNKQFVDKI